MDSESTSALRKVPEITLAFWVIKILATTLGETGGDALSMTLDLGYAVSSLVFLVIFAVAVTVQLAAATYNRFLYWGVIIATTTLGTTLADFADRSMGIGYTGGSALLLALLLLSFIAWRRATGSVAVEAISSRKAEVFYWVTILFSQTLGTALGDWVADTNDFGYERGAMVFSAGLAVVAGLYLVPKISRTALFWAAFVLTRPLGATLGDLIDKPVDHGGLAIGRFTASAALAAMMLACLFLLPQQNKRAI